MDDFENDKEVLLSVEKRHSVQTTRMHILMTLHTVVNVIGSVLAEDEAEDMSEDEYMWQRKYHRKELPTPPPVPPSQCQSLYHQFLQPPELTTAPTVTSVQVPMSNAPAGPSVPHEAHVVDKDKSLSFTSRDSNIPSCKDLLEPSNPVVSSLSSSQGVKKN